MKIPSPKSEGEETLALHFKIENLSPEREFKFHPARKWRFDFAFPEQKIAIECEGGTWTKGRHTRPAGYEADLEKYNAASMMGWRLLRFTTNQILSRYAITTIMRALA